jgi:hypothetical protein
MGVKREAKQLLRSGNFKVHHFQLSRTRSNTKISYRCSWTDSTPGIATTWSGLSKRMRRDMLKCRETLERSREANGMSGY